MNDLSKPRWHVRCKAVCEHEGQKHVVRYTSKVRQSIDNDCRVPHREAGARCDGRLKQ